MISDTDSESTYGEPTYGDRDMLMSDRGSGQPAATRS